MVERVTQWLNLEGQILASNMEYINTIPGEIDPIADTRDTGPARMAKNRTAKDIETIIPTFKNT